MTFSGFALRGFRYYRRTNLALALGFAAVVATLSGALLVGDSVRASLAHLVDQRLGRTGAVVSSLHPFREQLAGDLSGVPLIALEGNASAEGSRRRANHVQVYGADPRFWSFHGMPDPGGDAWISPALSRDLGAGAGDSILMRVEKLTAIPKESLHGRKDDVGKTVRLRIGGVRTPEQLGEFSLRLQQGAVRAAFVPLRRLQRELALAGRVNTVLLPRTPPSDVLKRAVTLDDLGIRIRDIDGGMLSVESESAVIADPVLRAIKSLAPDPHPVFAYLANSIRIGGRTVPYSLVAAVDSPEMPVGAGGIVLNEWAARELNARPGATVTLEYYLWGEGGSLLTRRTDFHLERVVPIRGLAADRQLAPEYPGITEAKSLHDWDPPFPMNLGLIRPKDEAYWNAYKTTPKAFIAYPTGRKLWASRFGSATSVRVRAVAGFAEALRGAIDPAQAGLIVMDTRAMGSEAARGSTDFGEYFAYFSFFVLISALILAGLLFRLGVEQRTRDVGMLRAAGWPISKISAVLLLEGAVVALGGCVVGVVAAVAYCAGILYGLRTWWQGAVGTTALRLSVNPLSLATGAAAGFVMALVVMWWSLRILKRRSPRALMAGSIAPDVRRGARTRSKTIAVAAAGCGLLLLAAGASKLIPAEGAFFGSAALLLIAGLVWIAAMLNSQRHSMLALDSTPAVWKLGARGAAFRPGRAVAGIALIASATFLIAGLDAFRQGAEPADDKRSGTGGFALVGESELPVFHDPNTSAGRASLNLGGNELDGVRFSSFRLRPGDDASCLNLYQPRNPRVLGAPAAFVLAGRFRFAQSVAEAPAERENPWLLLERNPAGGAIPAIADLNSITYTLHKRIGDELVLNPDSSRPVRLRLVGALAGSTLQSELIISEENFIRAFPEEQGYRFFLIDTPPAGARGVESSLEESLADFGFEASGSMERLAGYRQVENTYLSTFQALGALGLLLGTVGLAAMLLRNVLERRRELALMRALGFNRGHIAWMVIAENLFIAAAGLAIGVICAVIAVMPTVLARGGRPPVAAILALLIAVPATALISSLLAVRSVVRAPLLTALKAE